MAEQGTFGGRFGGRKSLQSRKSGRFGGTFGGRNSQTETKLMHVRRHFRRPKLPDRDESLLSGASFGSRKAASPAMFGGRKSFGCRTWFLPKGRNLAPFAHFASKPSKHAYFSTKACIQVPRGLKHEYTPSTTLHSHTIKLHCSKSHQKPIGSTYTLTCILPLKTS